MKSNYFKSGFMGKLKKRSSKIDENDEINAQKQKKKKHHTNTTGKKEKNISRIATTTSENVDIETTQTAAAANLIREETEK